MNDIMKKIFNMPQFYYQWSTGDGILGGATCNNNGTGDCGIILDIWKNLKEYYERDNKNGLSDEEKKDYARLVHRMQVYCEGDTIPRETLKGKLNLIPEKDKNEIKWQIDMYECGRRYYSI